MRIFSIIVSVSFLIALFGCASGSSIVTGKTRLATNPNDVKLYLEPPSKFESIGIVEASSEVEFSSQVAQDEVINELKLQAAKIGANGILITNTDNKSSGVVGYYGSGIFYANSSDTKTASGKAIYVIKD